MNKEYDKKQKSKASYWVGDVLISFSLLIAFKSYRHIQEVSYICLALIPILFLWNSCKLHAHKERWQSTSYEFDKKFAAISILGGGFIYLSRFFTPCSASCSEVLLSYFIAIMVGWYGKMVLTIKLSDGKPTKIANFNKKEYEIVNDEKFEEIFKEPDVNRAKTSKITKKS